MQRIIFHMPVIADVGNCAGDHFEPAAPRGSVPPPPSIRGPKKQPAPGSIPLPSAKPGTAGPPAGGVWGSVLPTPGYLLRLQTRVTPLSLVTKIPPNHSRFEHRRSLFGESLCFRQSFSTRFYTIRVYIIPPNCLQADSLSGALTTLLPKGQPD